MLTDKECDFLNSRMKGTMIEALGIKFLPSDDDVALAEMPICDATRQYFGILHGGASLTLAETIAGAGSLHIIGYDESAKVCGVQVSGNHVSMSETEGKVYGRATLVSAGRSTHVWNVDITGEDGKLLSTERVMNRILHDGKKNQ
jgi:uncharacterized protein (TIGR00369 family)